MEEPQAAYAAGAGLKIPAFPSRKLVVYFTINYHSSFSRI